MKKNLKKIKHTISSHKHKVVEPYKEFKSGVKSGYQDTMHFIKIHSINITLIGTLLGIICFGLFLIWVSNFRIPDFSSFEDRKISQSTKIYDRTGEVLLFDVNQDIRRTVIPIENMGENIQEAIIAIEDDAFYEHNGIRVKAIARAIVSNLTPGGLTQGGSTITQQIVKNTLLTSEKRISRKIKEIVISLRIEQEMTKDQILEIYLNEAPFGGNIYGVQEASSSFYGKNPEDMSIAEAAFLAALPQAPSRYSPYGKNTDLLVSRQQRVLKNMKDLDFITEEEYQDALKEEVSFLPLNRLGIKAPHFVFYVIDQLETRYGENVVESGGLKVITTINYELQQEGEAIVLKHALDNEKQYNASNASLVAMDPNTGEILTMIGSRNYFDENIDGKFNVALAKRQPGSSFKPFIYATAFKEGYLPETVVFDTPTEFQTTCDPEGRAISGSQSNCYKPQNYDGSFVGPVSLRNALGSSRNVPAVKLLYLVGIPDALKTAKDFGLKTLTNPNQYGLTLVLGGGEVTLLDMVTAYGVFATEGIYNEPVSILEVQDKQGNILEKFDQPTNTRVYPEEPIRKLNDVLSDNNARLGLFGSVNNFMYFGERDVAGKTGTTNNNKDAWMMGYSPNIVVGVWSGNNDNTSMTRGSTISGLLWREYMNTALQKTSNENFTPPSYSTEGLKPILKGNWMGGEVVRIDSISKKLATEWTPEETIEELVITDVNSILHWINKDNPISGEPTRSGNQYINWQYSVKKWWEQNKQNYPTIDQNDVPTQFDDIHTESTQPDFEVEGLNQNDPYENNEEISFSIDTDTYYAVEQVDIYINNSYITTLSGENLEYSFNPSFIGSIQSVNTLKIVLKDSVFNTKEKEFQFSITQ
jgi:1A family penicillin-binding protein